MHAKPIGLAFLFLLGRQVAFVDLSHLPGAGETGSQVLRVRGGGVLYHGNAPHPLPGTPTVSLRLTRVITMKEGPFVKDVVEVVVTNTGKEAISVPVGDDPAPLLAPTERGRSYFEFAIKLGKDGRLIATAMSASNIGHPESSSTLQPGDTVVFWLPAGTWKHYAQQANEGRANVDATVSLSLYRKMMERGNDYNDIVGESVPSQNSLPLPDAEGTEIVR